MKVIIFGGSGFLGSNLIDELLKRGWEVINIDIKGNIKNNDSFKFYNLNILNANLRNIFDIEKPDIIYNFAAMADIGECNKFIKESFDINIIGNLRILEAIRFLNEKNSPVYVYASSVYVNNNRSGIYGITKRAAEDTIKYYHEKHGIDYVILRYGTVYGNGANYFNSITNLIRNALKTKVISYYGTGEEIREYIHIDDAMNATAECWYNNINKIVNISGLNPIRAKDLCRILKDILGYGYKIEFRNEYIIDHYDITPYQDREEIPKKIVLDKYVEIGAGLLNIIKEIRYEKEKD